MDRPLGMYVSDLVGSWTARFGGHRTAWLEGTLAKIDLSGFTKLSERLARSTNTGAEELNSVLNDVFAGLIEISRNHGGDILQFGGDALILWFEGQEHRERALASTWLQQRYIMARPAEKTTLGPVRLKMSAGVATGEVGFVLSGVGHREVFVVGPVANEVIRLEKEAPSNAVYVDRKLSGIAQTTPVGTDTFRLRRSPRFRSPVRLDPPNQEIESYVPPEVWEVIGGGAPLGEHRRSAVAFVLLDLPEDIESGGLETACSGIDTVTAAIENARRKFGVQWTAADLGDRSAVFLLYSSAPIARERGEEKLLRASSLIHSETSGLSVRIGVHSGRVFAADIGSAERRTYALIGDTTNMAARLAFRAGSGQTLASQEVLGRSGTSHEIVRMEPFSVKGKRTPVNAAILGRELDPGRRLEESSMPFIGRREETERLQRYALDSQDAVKSLIITGEAGIGKSRLITECLPALNRAGCQVVMARGSEFLRERPFEALRSALRSLLGVTDRDEFALDISPELRSFRALVNLPLGLAPTDDDELAGLDPELVESLRNQVLIDAISNGLTHRANDRLILVVEDFHWLDQASKSFVIQFMSNPPCPLMVTSREVDHETEIVFPGVSEIPLGPLKSDDARRLLLAACGDVAVDDDRLEVMLSEAKGHPLFLIELGRLAAMDPADVPDSVDEVISTRITALSIAGRRLLREVSVLGTSIEVDRLARVLDDDELNIPSRWTELHQFLDLSDFDHSIVRFRHDLYRRCAYEGLSVRRRREIHSKMADLMLDDPKSESSIVANHLFVAGRFEEAFEWMVRTAQGFRAEGAFGDASMAFERALIAAGNAHTVDPVHLTRVARDGARVQEICGQYDRSLRSLEIARKEGGDDAALLLRKSTVLEQTGEIRRASRFLTRAEHLSPNDETAIDIRIRRSSILRQRGNLRAAMKAAEGALNEARRIGDEGRQAEALQMMEMIGGEMGLPSTRVHGDIAREILIRRGDHRNLGDLLLNLGARAKDTDDWGRASDLYSESEAAYRRAGDAIGRAFARNNRAEIFLDQGLYEAALGEIAEARRMFRAGGMIMGSAATSSTLGTIHARRGEWELARRYLAEAKMALKENGFDTLVLDAILREVENELLASNTTLAKDLIREGRELAVRVSDVGLLQLSLDRFTAVSEIVNQQNPRPDGIRVVLDCARQLQALFEVVMCLQVLTELGMADRSEEQELEALCARLGIEQLPPFVLVGHPKTR